MSEEDTWTTVKVPRMVYFPTGGHDFDHSGMRVEPSDHIRLLPGSNRIEINGVEHRLMIPCDNLLKKLDANGVIQLDKPAPAVRISAGGEGWAVGRMGEVRAKGLNWDPKLVHDWEGDAATSIPLFNELYPDAGRGASKFPIFEEDQPRQIAFNQGPKLKAQDQKIVDEFLHELEKHLTPPDTEMREITLRDGSKARALFSTITGKQIGTPIRLYQANYDDQGRQLPSAAPTHGPKSKFNMEEYRQRLVQQTQDARLAPSTWNENITPVQVVAPAKQDPALYEGTKPEPNQPATTTGAQHLDDLLATSQAPGWPLRKVSVLRGPVDCTNALMQAAGASFADGIQAAFGRIHLLGGGAAKPLVAIKLGPELDDKLRLAIAEELPVLDHMVKDHSSAIAVVLVIPEWDDITTPALIRYLPKLSISVTPHERDPRFLTATIRNAGSISFPRP